MPLPIFLGTNLWDDPLPSRTHSIWGIKARAPALCVHLHTCRPKEAALWFFQPCGSLSWEGSCWVSLVLDEKLLGQPRPLLGSLTPEPSHLRSA